MQIDSQLLPRIDTSILVAFSGGPDSTALLHLLHSEGYSLHAAHVHHGLRGDEADADAEYCAEFCRERGIPFTLLRVDVSAERERGGGGVQEAARRLRYDVLERCALEVGASLIATAHNSDDNAETVLLNIVRGTGTDGLRGIPEKRGNIVRPLLHVSRAEIVAYCFEHNLAPRQDSSNDSTKYARNEVRHKLIPYLRERFNPNILDSLNRLSAIAATESHFLDKLAADWLEPASVIDAGALAGEPVAMQRRVIRYFLKAVANLQDVGFEHTELIRRNLRSDFAATLPGNVVIEGNDKWVWRVPPAELRLAGQAQPDAPVTAAIRVPGSTEFAGWRVSALGELSEEVVPVVRCWTPGDRMRFTYGRKKLKNLFQEARTPMQLRWTLPLLIDQKSAEVLAIANGRVSDLLPNLSFTAERIEPTAG